MAEGRDYHNLVVGELHSRVIVVVVGGETRVETVDLGMVVLVLGKHVARFGDLA